MNKDIKKCKICGRIITDEKNITGLCPKHQKGLNDGALVTSLAACGIFIKKFGPKIINKIIKK